MLYKIFVFSVLGENVATRARQGVWKGGHNKSVGSQVGLERKREKERERVNGRRRKREGQLETE